MRKVIIIGSDIGATVGLRTAMLAAIKPSPLEIRATLQCKAKDIDLLFKSPTDHQEHGWYRKFEKKKR